MKLTVILLFIACLQVSAKGYSQEKITLDLKDAPLKKVFQEIKKQVNVSFFFSEEKLKNAKAVTLRVTNASLEEVLRTCFTGQPFTYTIIENVVTIKPKEETVNAVLSLMGVPTAAMNVKGKVTNEKNEPVIGATVTEKRTKNATATNESGDFMLLNVAEHATLIISSISYETQEIKLNSRSEITVRLKINVGELNSVIVNTGYQQIPKERATGSFEFVNNEELNRRVGTDILSRLDGVSSAVLFDRRSLSANTNTVSPTNIIIRGITALSSSMTSPLIVVNNFPYDGDINNINPNDVENVTILKDAAAASIYGAKAANGVIVITTKRGKLNQPVNVSFNTNVNIIQKPDLFYYPKMSSSEFIDVETFLFNKGFYNALLNPSNVNMPAATPVVEILNNRKLGLITSMDSASQIDALRNVDARNGFDEYIYRRSINQQYSLSLSGGSEKIRYLFSGGFDNNDANLIGNNSERVTLRSDNFITPFKNLEIGVGLAYSSVNSKLNSLGEIGNPSYDFKAGVKLYPYAQFADANGTPLNVIHDYRIGYVDTAGGGRLQDWKYQPLNEMKNADNTSRSHDILINIGVNYKISNFLGISLNYQFERSAGISRNYNSLKTYYARNLINLFSQISGDNVIYQIPDGGILDEGNSNLTAQAGRAQVNFSKSFNQKNQIDGIVGSEIRQRRNTSTYRRLYGYDDQTLSFSNVDYINFYPNYGNRGMAQIPNGDSYMELLDRFVSVYGNAAYTYDKRYTISISGRKDAANVFGVDINNKWKPLWSAGVAWHISNERFFNVKSVPYLKLRFTYGYQGNVNNSLSPYTIIAMQPASNSIINQPYSTISRPADPSLSWETIRQSNIGIDFGLFTNRISGSIEAYVKETDNLIYPSIIDPTVGFSTISKNSASMRTKGVDVTINSLNFTGKFTWKTSFLLSTVKDRVTDYNTDFNKSRISSLLGNGISLIPRKDRPVYAIYSLPFAGLDPNTGDPLGYKGKEISKNYLGMLIQTLDTANITYHGSAIPTLFGAFSNTFSFKGISITANISYRFGYYFKKNTIAYRKLFTSGITHYDFSKRWMKPGDEQVTIVPSMIYPLSNSYRDDFYAASSINVLKGDNIRLQYITIGYDVNQKLVKRLRFQNFNIYATVTNLGIIWRANKEKLDPDYDIANAWYPVPRQWAIGFRGNF